MFISKGDPQLIFLKWGNGPSVAFNCDEFATDDAKKKDEVCLCIFEETPCGGPIAYACGWHGATQFVRCDNRLQRLYSCCEAVHRLAFSVGSPIIDFADLEAQEAGLTLVDRVQNFATRLEARKSVAGAAPPQSKQKGRDQRNVGDKMRS